MSTSPSSWYVLLDLQSYGLVLVKLTARTQPVAKKIAIASGAVDYNILQNNGKIAHQEVGHVSLSPAAKVMRYQND